MARSIIDYVPEDALPLWLLVAAVFTALRSIPDGQREAVYDSMIQSLFGDTGDGGDGVNEAPKTAAQGQQTPAAHPSGRGSAHPSQPARR